ncbi:hypothetical protein C8F04DRAFT_1188957 [Mycena alexandri]|uniref:Uncharacterized protein n=1 Tax=Mycena alexandri TaxID=1745969 RepID=A0AAD6SHI3_9AGAR|nr:hypothetical protein C8F04DRAFT_1188957 [Mycena alexandri]
MVGSSRGRFKGSRRRLRTCSVSRSDGDDNFAGWEWGIWVKSRSGLWQLDKWEDTLKSKKLNLVLRSFLCRKLPRFRRLKGTSGNIEQVAELRRLPEDIGKTGLQSDRASSKGNIYTLFDELRNSRLAENLQAKSKLHRRAGVSAVRISKDLVRVAAAGQSEDVAAKLEQNLNRCIEAKKRAENRLATRGYCCDSLAPLGPTARMTIVAAIGAY